jgi:hypothetical protein
MITWVEAQAALEAARAAEATYDGAVWWPAFHAAGSGGPAIAGDIDAESERRTDARCAAEDALIATPAPDLPAAIWKIEYARKRWEDFDDWPATWWAAVMGDLRRLAA